MPVPPSAARPVLVVDPYAPQDILVVSSSVLLGIDPYAVDDIMTAAAAYDGARAEEVYTVVEREGDLAWSAASIVRDVAGYIASILRPPYDRYAAALAVLYNALVAVDNLADLVASILRPRRTCPQLG